MKIWKRVETPVGHVDIYVPDDWDQLSLAERMRQLNNAITDEIQRLEEMDKELARIIQPLF